MYAPRIKPAIALTEAEERDAYPHPGRRLSRYEVLISTEKPLPLIPVALPLPLPQSQRPLLSRELRRRSSRRIPSHRQAGQSYLQLEPLPQSSAASSDPSSSSHGMLPVTAPRRHTNVQTLKTTTSLPSKMRTVTKTVSFSASSALPPGASGHSSSKKINQLVGHNLDIPTDSYDQRSKAGSASHALEYYERTSSSGSGSGSASDSDDESCFNIEEGLLPLMEDDEDAWVPRTLGAGVIPSPLNLHRDGSKPSIGSVSMSNDELSPIHQADSNFRLSGGSPKRWDPAYGQFTDKRAANDYHRIASELATPPLRHTVMHTVPPEKHANKMRSTGRLRFSGTAAIARLWDSPPTHGESKRVMSPPVPASLPPPLSPPPPLPLPLPPLPLPPTHLVKPIATAAAGTSGRRAVLRKQLPVRPPAGDNHSVERLLPPKPISTFEHDSEDEVSLNQARKWWRRSDEEERGSSSEWPSMQWAAAKRQEEEREKEKTTNSFSDGVKGLLANARDRALLSPAERRRSDLRKSIKVLRVPDPI